MKMSNKKILVLIDESDKLIYKVLKYSFNKDNIDLKTIPKTYTPFDRDNLAIEINSDYDEVIFYDYYDQFYLLLPLIKKKIVKKWIIKEGIAMLCCQHIFQNLLQLFEYKERGLIDYIFTTSYGLYKTMEDKMSYLVLDYKNEQKIKQEKCIGIINIDYDENSNFYNEISGAALSSINTVKVLNAINATKNFERDFGVNIIEERDFEKIIYGNMVNLDCAFSEVSIYGFLLSMDAGIPCILGNTSILNNNPKLKKLLVLNSDDDVNEIKEKIESSIENKSEIMKLYADWRKDYTNYSKKSVEELLKIGG